MDFTQSTVSSSSGIHSGELWLAATIHLGRPIYHPPIVLATSAIGTLREQLEIAELAGSNPWGFDPDDALQAARRTVLQHARRAR